MKRVKRLLSFRKQPQQEQQRDDSASREISVTASLGPLDPVVEVFEVHTEDEVINKPIKRVSLQRTKSRSVECLKRPETRVITFRDPEASDAASDSQWSASRRPRHLGPGQSQRLRLFQPGAEASFESLPRGVPQRAFSVHPVRLRGSPNRSLEGSSGNLSSTRASLRAAAAATSAFYANNKDLRLARCGSSPPVGRGSLTSMHGLSGAGATLEELKSSLAAPAISALPSQEDLLLLELHRKQEATWLRQPAKIREETNVRKNIKRREIVDAKKKEAEEKIVVRASPKEKKPAVSSSSSSSRIRTREPSGTSNASSTKPRDHFMSGLIRAKEGNGAKKDVLGGLLRTRAVLMAPIGGATIQGTGMGTPIRRVSRDSVLPKVMSKPLLSSADLKKLELWAPPSHTKIQDRNLVRKVVAAHLNPSAASELAPDLVGNVFNRDCLQWHNHYRGKHSAPPMQLDHKLCASAQHWANYLAHRDELLHGNPAGVGESLFAWPMPALPEASAASIGANSRASSREITGKDVAVYWYKTLAKYYFLKDENVLHVYACQFSQMVWASSQLMGCGKARSRSGKIIVVAHYSPAGNVPGRFHLNVMPASDPAQTADSAVPQTDEENQRQRERDHNPHHRTHVVSGRGHRPHGARERLLRRVRKLSRQQNHGDQDGGAEESDCSDDDSQRADSCSCNTVSSM